MKPPGETPWHAVAVPLLFEFTDAVVDGNGGPRLGPITVSVPDQGVTVVAGPSGAGKSTLLRLCNRLEVASAGRVRFRGTDLTDVDPLALRRQVGMVFQRPILFPGTVEDNLRVADPDGDPASFVVALERAGLDASFLGRLGDDLSGGEAQRACLARTLVTGPQALLLDEPTSALDPAATRLLERLARSLTEDGVPMLWVSHDLDQVGRVADRTIVLVGGRVAEPTEAAAFLGSGGEPADGEAGIRPNEAHGATGEDADEP
jgi:putative ABC transport system ATP-binding protein